MVDADIDDVSLDTKQGSFFFYHITAFGFGPIGLCITYDASVRGVQGYWQNRIAGQRWTGRQANGRKLCLSEFSGGNNDRYQECRG